MLLCLSGLFASVVLAFYYSVCDWRLYLGEITQFVGNLKDLLAFVVFVHLWTYSVTVWI